jgi:hypothetical protein
MKCIHCGTDSPRRYRLDGRCYKCKHLFAFEPTKDSSRVTDGHFKAAIDRVSGEGRVRFTERALWFEFNRKWMKPRLWRSPYGWFPLAGATLGAFVGMVIGMPDKIAPLAVAGGMGGVAVGTIAGLVASRGANARSPGRPRRPRIPFPEFRNAYLRNWRAAHGAVPGLLSTQELAFPAGRREVPADVAAFSFDRAVVTDRWETAAMLVANRFHFEHNCAVLSYDGFPGDIAGTVKTMLRRNPNLTVFALHDASPDGCLLPLLLRGKEWFPDTSIRIVDVGLRPAMVRQLGMPAIHLRGSLDPPSLAEVLPPKDVAWLAWGNVGELAALRPAQVMRALYHAIAAVAAADANRTPLASGGVGGGGGFFFIPMGSGGSGDTADASVDGFG